MENNKKFRWIREDIDISSIYQRLPDPLKKSLLKQKKLTKVYERAVLWKRII